MVGTQPFNQYSNTGDTMTSLNQGSNKWNVPKLYVMTGWRAPHNPHSAHCELHWWKDTAASTKTTSPKTNIPPQSREHGTLLEFTIKLFKQIKTHWSWRFESFWTWRVWNDSTWPLWWLIMLTVAPPIFAVAFLTERLPLFNVKFPPIVMAPAARNWFQWRHGIQLETCVLSFDLTRWPRNMQLPSCRHWE